VRFFSELGLSDDGRIRLIRGSGVDTARFTPFERSRDRSFRVLFAARLLWEKGVREYVDAARWLRSSRAKEVEEVTSVLTL